MTDKRKVNSEVLTEIARRLEHNPTVFITGRSIAWLSENVLSQLENQVSDIAALDHLLVLAEKGAVLLEYQNGHRQISIDRKVRVPAIIAQRAKQLTEWQEFSPYVFFDETKQTMVSIELLPDGDFQTQKKALSTMSTLLEKLVIDHKLANQFQVLETTIAVDIQSRAVGKGFATEKAWSILKKKGLVRQEVIAFGDSQEDLEIGKKLTQIGVPFIFVFVGEEKTKDAGFIIVHSIELYDKGTLHFLRGLTT